MSGALKHYYSQFGDGSRHLGPISSRVGNLDKLVHNLNGDKDKAEIFAKNMAHHMNKDIPFQDTRYHKFPVTPIDNHSFNSGVSNLKMDNHSINQLQAYKKAFDAHAELLHKPKKRDYTGTDLVLK